MVAKSQVVEETNSNVETFIYNIVMGLVIIVRRIETLVIWLRMGLFYKKVQKTNAIETIVLVWSSVEIIKELLVEDVWILIPTSEKVFLRITKEKSLNFVLEDVETRNVINARNWSSLLDDNLVSIFFINLISPDGTVINLLYKWSNERIVDPSRVIYGRVPWPKNFVAWLPT